MCHTWPDRSHGGLDVIGLCKRFRLVMPIPSNLFVVQKSKSRWNVNPYRALNMTLHTSGKLPHTHELFYIGSLFRSPMIGMKINFDRHFYFMLVYISYVPQMTTTPRWKLKFQLHNRLIWKPGRNYAVQVLLVTLALITSVSELGSCI